MSQGVSKRELPGTVVCNGLVGSPSYSRFFAYAQSRSLGMTGLSLATACAAQDKSKRFGRSGLRYTWQGAAAHAAPPVDYGKRSGQATASVSVAEAARRAAPRNFSNSALTSSA